MGRPQLTKSHPLARLASGVVTGSPTAGRASTLAALDPLAEAVAGIDHSVWPGGAALVSATPFAWGASKSGTGKDAKSNEDVRELHFG